MNVAAVTRVVSFMGLGAMFVTDYMLGWWVKDIPKEVYLLMLALALGVDATFLKETVVRVLTKGISKPPEGNGK
jgi:hypothetical protein